MCPTCMEEATIDSRGCCAWCDTRIENIERREVSRSHAGTTYLMDEETIQRARELYAEGLSFRKVAAELHDRTGYSSVVGLANRLSEIFQVRGWPRRDRVAATQAASLKHGKARRGEVDLEHRKVMRRARGEARGVLCAGVRTGYPRKGEPCKRPARRGSEYCVAHDPALDETRREHLARMREAAA